MTAGCPRTCSRHRVVGASVTFKRIENQESSTSIRSVHLTLVGYVAPSGTHTSLKSTITCSLGHEGLAFGEEGVAQPVSLTGRSRI